MRVRLAKLQPEIGAARHVDPAPQDGVVVAIVHDGEILVPAAVRGELGAEVMARPVRFEADIGRELEGRIGTRIEARGERVVGEDRADTRPWRLGANGRYCDRVCVPGMERNVSSTSGLNPTCASASASSSRWLIAHAAERAAALCAGAHFAQPGNSTVTGSAATADWESPARPLVSCTAQGAAAARSRAAASAPAALFLWRRGKGRTFGTVDRPSLGAIELTGPFGPVPKWARAGPDAATIRARIGAPRRGRECRPASSTIVRRPI